MGRQRATVMVCDNPDCGVTTLIEDGQEPIGYYLGKGMWHGGGGGGPLPALYAHRIDCIVPAVQAAIRGGN